MDVNRLRAVIYRDVVSDRVQYVRLIHLLFLYYCTITSPGGNEAGSVPVSGDSVLHLRADGVQVPRHPGAATSHRPGLQQTRARLPRTSR